VFFLPVFDTLWKGNVSGLVALAAALVAAGSGGAAAMGTTLLKISPAPLVAVLHRSARRSALAVACVGAVFVALAPAAWRDFATVLWNVTRGSADFPTNLAPHVQLAVGVPALGAASGAIHFLELALAVGLGVAAIGLRARGAAHSATVAACGAMLLTPGSLWLHYFVVLLPLAAIAWRNARAGERMALVGGAALIWAGLVALPLATLGGAVMWAASFRATLRGRPPTPPTERPLAMAA
jgi:hypothetical protein